MKNDDASHLVTYLEVSYVSYNLHCYSTLTVTV